MSIKSGKQTGKKTFHQKTLIELHDGKIRQIHQAREPNYNEKIALTFKWSPKLLAGNSKSRPGIKAQSRGQLRFRPRRKCLRNRKMERQESVMDWMPAKA